MNPSVTADNHATQRHIGVALALIFALSFVHFWLCTRPVRLANYDDAAFQAVVSADWTEAYMTQTAFAQARFYFATPVYRYLLLSPYAVDSNSTFSFLRAVLLFAEAGLVGWLAARVLGNALLGGAVTLVIVSTLHLPVTFFPVLSYFPMSFGFITLLGALHFHLSFLRERCAHQGFLAGALLLLSCLSLELFVVYVPAFLALSLHVHGWHLRALLRDSVIPVSVGVGYLATYQMFAHEFPSTYAGTHFSNDFVAAVRILVRQTVGVTPGFELVVNRLPSERPAPLLRSFTEVLSIIGRTPIVDFALGLAQAAVLTVLLALGTRVQLAAARYWSWLVGFALLTNLPIAFSEKYHVFIFQRQYPYIYGFFSFCLLAWAAVSFTAWLSAGPVPRRRFVLAPLVALFALACLSAKISNHSVLADLSVRFNSPVTPR